jgi:hypothetical protein
LITTRNFDAVLLCEMHHPAIRKVLQGCPIELIFLLLLFCRNGFGPIVFHNLVAKVPSNVNHIVISWECAAVLIFAATVEEFLSAIWHRRRLCHPHLRNRNKRPCT